MKISLRSIMSFFHIFFVVNGILIFTQFHSINTVFCLHFLNIQKSSLSLEVHHSIEIAQGYHRIQWMVMSESNMDLTSSQFVPITISRDRLMLLSVSLCCIHSNNDIGHMVFNIGYPSYSLN